VHGNITERRIGWHTVQQLRYDAEHQVESITVTRWHDKPRLKEAGKEQTPPASTVQTTRYRYDALGRRIDKTNEFGSTRFGWDGDLLALEIRGSKQSEYLYEPDSFVPLAKIESQARIVGQEQPAQTNEEQARPKDFEVYYYHCDQIGAPQELTDEQGNIVWAVDYKVWGRAKELNWQATGTEDADPHGLNAYWPGRPRKITARATGQSIALNKVEQNLRFQGQYFDSESGLHYNRFRYYDPQTGRFVHQDGFVAQTVQPNPIGCETLAG
jgi:RHS repeat-associated protein